MTEKQTTFSFEVARQILFTEQELNIDVPIKAHMAKLCSNGVFLGS